MEQLQANLKVLRLSGMANRLPVRYQEAKASELDYLAFLELLVGDEHSRRKENLLNRRIKLAHFPQMKTLEDFDFSFNPAISKREVLELASSRFVHEAKNVLLVGPPGVGKTHLTLAIGLAAIQNGYTVYYRSAFDLVEDLAEAFRNEQRKKLVHQLTGYGLLILDEFGMKKMPPHAADCPLPHSDHTLMGNKTILAGTRECSQGALIRQTSTGREFGLSGQAFLRNGRRVRGVAGKAMRACMPALRPDRLSDSAWISSGLCRSGR